MVAQQNTKHLVRIALCMRQEIEDDLFICSGKNWNVAREWYQLDRIINLFEINCFTFDVQSK